MYREHIELTFIPADEFVDKALFLISQQIQLVGPLLLSLLRQAYIERLFDILITQMPKYMDSSIWSLI